MLVLGTRACAWVESFAVAPCKAFEAATIQHRASYNKGEDNTNFKATICREQSETLSTNKGRFCNNSEIDRLISKRLSVENKVKLSQLTRADFVTIAKLTD